MENEKISNHLKKVYHNGAEMITDSLKQVHLAKNNCKCARNTCGKYEITAGLLIQPTRVSTLSAEFNMTGIVQSSSQGTLIYILHHITFLKKMTFKKSVFIYVASKVT